ncbi:MAG: histidine kinase, partial [Bacteroidia bacterium]|nr:histidine kinase [Bacteroidia bacterium]
KIKHKILYVLSENGAFAFNTVTAKFTSIIAGFGQSNIEEYKDIVFNQQQIYLVGGDLVMLLPLNPPSVQHRNEALAITHLYSNYVPFDSKKVVRLSPSQNNIRILFSVPWLNLNDKLNFAYKLNDADWENIDGGNRELNLLALSPNKYTIQIKAESTSGFESNIEKVSFEILPPIWERWWFYFLMIVFVGAIFYALYAYRIKQINRQNKLLADNFELEKNLQKSMLSSIKAQMNPHFIFNALNTIQSYIYLNDKQNASRFLAKFSSLTRKILEMSNADTISLDMELSSLQLYLELEKMRFEESFEFNIKVDENIQTAMIRLPSMILQPYIENAIKHGLLHKDDDRKLNIHFSLNQTNLIVSIDDNGIGRKRASHINATRNEQHQSFSTQANQTRLELLMQSKKNKLVVEYIDKVDNQKQTMGTTVILTIPVIENSLVN